MCLGIREQNVSNSLKWYAFISSTATASDTTGTPGGLSDAVHIGIPAIVSLVGIIVGAVVTVWSVWYAKKTNQSKCQLLTSINLHGNWDKPE